MSITYVRLCTFLLAATITTASVAAAQHEGHQPATSGSDAAQAEIAECRQAQAGITATIDAAVKRLDDARQTNAASVMRAATEDLQAVLADIKV
jgi:hypothetical protein